jgi:hypothetical protein
MRKNYFGYTLVGILTKTLDQKYPLLAMYKEKFLQKQTLNIQMETLETWNTWKHFLELKKQLKPKFQPFSFSFAKNEFLFFAILKKKSIIVRLFSKNLEFLKFI